MFDVVRAQVPKIRLDDVFEKKDDIANIVTALTEQMRNAMIEADQISTSDVVPREPGVQPRGGNGTAP